MNQDEIKANKEAFIATCHEYIHRDGLDEILSYIDTTDFYIAPSSTGFHLNEEGGLCRHSLNVFHTAMKINEMLLLPAVEDETTPIREKLDEESIAIATLFHDLCKTKLYRKTERWKKDENNRWVSYPGYEVNDEFPFGHGEKSCIIIGWFMKLKQDELLAIRWHMGMFEVPEYGSSTRFAYRAAMDKSPLVALLQVADMSAANFLEKTTTYK